MNIAIKSATIVVKTVELSKAVVRQLDRTDGIKMNDQLIGRLDSSVIPDSGWQEFILLIRDGTAMLARDIYGTYRATLPKLII